MAQDPLLEVRGLCARYHSRSGTVHAVEDVDFEVKRGQSVGIAGESACGKSTLGYSIMRMLQGGKATGTATFDGRDLLGMPAREFDEKYRWKRISMVFQGAMNSLDPVFTLQEQFDEILDRHGGDRRAVRDSLESVSMDAAILPRYPHELSGGMKQRAVIAMALLLKPDLLIADEPTTALDVLTQAQIINVLKGLKAGGMSLVLITHDLALLSELADSVGIMYAGQMVEFGASDQVYGSPRHPYTRGLLESIPRLRGPPPKYIPGTPPPLTAPPSRCGFADRCGEAVERCQRNPPMTAQDGGYVRCWLYE